MSRKIFPGTVVLAIFTLAGIVWAYPPGVGVTSKSKNCLSCHASNGPWADEQNTILDLLDRETKKSAKQPDGTFLISAHRGEAKKLLVVVGRSAKDKAESPLRNGWIFIDTARIKTNSLNKFATGWNVDLPAACRLVGDPLKGYEGAKITVLPLTLQPGDEAGDAELAWQVMLTKGESVKGKPKEGMIGNYFEKKVVLRVTE